MSKMVQEFMVVCCFSCQTFQVHQVKKSSNKWICKICHGKQSVQKIYGQGRAADCRKHVQKLNMLRGQKEASEQQMLNHPPEDYAETFEKDGDCHGNEPRREDHPVLLTGVGSKWKLFTEPHDSTSEEEFEETGGLYTTDTKEFREMTKRKRKATYKHSLDDPAPHPLSKATQDTNLLPPPPPSSSSSSHSHTPSGPIHPYSDVSDEMGVYLSGLKSTKSCYLHSSKDRYQRFEDFHSDDIDDGTKTTAKSVQNLYTGRWEDEESVAATIPEPRCVGMSQEERIASIRKDISRFSRPTKVASDAIPVASSRWSTFMNESEEDGESEGEEEEEEEWESEEEGEGRVKTHMLQTKLVVARYRSTVSNPNTSGD